MSNVTCGTKLFCHQLTRSFCTFPAVAAKAPRKVLGNSGGGGAGSSFRLSGGDTSGQSAMVRATLLCSGDLKQSSVGFDRCGELCFRRHAVSPDECMEVRYRTFCAAGNKYAGGNPVCPRPTPDWQKDITGKSAGTARLGFPKQ